MKYYVEESLRDFKACGGAVKTIEILEELGRTKEVENYIEEAGEYYYTTINDFLWFETDFIFLELLKISKEEARKFKLI